MLDLRETHLSFRPLPDDLVCIDGWDAKIIGKVGNSIGFMDARNPRITEVFEIRHLNQLNADGKIKHEPGYFLNKLERSIAPFELDDDCIADLSPEHQDRIESKYAMVRAYEDMRAAGLLKVNDDLIKASMTEIRNRAEEYLISKLPCPEAAEKYRKWKAGEGPKPPSLGMVKVPDECSPRSLRGWASKVKKLGKKGLIDRVNHRGNINSQFTAEEITLLAKVVKKSYLVQPPVSIETTVRDVKMAFKEENDRRANTGLPELRVPGRDKIREFIDNLDKFTVLVARYGAKEALRRMRATKCGLENLRPFQRLEMDEWKIDLFTIMVECGLFHIFSQEELEALGLLDRTKRWWLVAAIDCRTRVIAGMALTCNPKASGALHCLRMVVSDKGDIANAAGAVCPWNMFAKPEILATDNGAAFKSTVFTNACADLGIHALRTIAGKPSMRGCIERVFRTASTSLLPDLNGRTMSNTVDRGDYDAEANACLSVDDLCRAIVRWIVDIYHNRPQEGLNGLTPLEQWKKDLSDGNYPLHAAPTARQKRLAFGVHTERKVQKSGIRVLNIQYHSPRLVEHFLSKGNETVKVRWSDDDIGVIEACLDGKWYEVEAVQEGFKGMRAHDWVATMRSLRAKYGRHRELTETIVFNAVRTFRRSMRKENCPTTSWTKA